ncbi:MAG: hypothetical protein AAGJ08_17195 [Cyanobacteria bacterium P01_H01_bin.35]
MLVYIVLFLSLLASLAFGVWIFKKLPQWNSIDRYFTAAIPTVTFIFIVFVLIRILDAPFEDWNAIRLAPTFALTHGYQLYYGADTGPILNTIYGPITALAYLPTTLAISPTGAVMMGAFISAAFFFIPILWLVVCEIHESQKVMSLNRSYKLLLFTYAFYAFISFFFFSFLSSLYFSAFNIHADAIALGLGAAACGFLYCRKHKDSLLSLLLSAIMIVLAIWAKQTALPLLIALPTYVLLADGRRCFKLYLLCIVISGLTISALLLTIFNPEYTFFNMLTIPGQHPWRVPGYLSDTQVIALVASGKKVPGGKILPLLKAGIEMIFVCLVPAFIIFWRFRYQFLFLPTTFDRITGWLRYNRWSMLLIVAFFMIPTSLLGRVKVGGAINAFSFTLYFLAASATLAVFRLILDSGSINTSFSKLFTPLKFLTLALVITFFLNGIQLIGMLYPRLQKLPNNPQQVAYNYARHHPGEAYFPWNPLSSLMAEGKLYHFEYALEDRLLAGYPVNKENFKSYIPSNIQLLAFSNRNDGYVKQFLPEFSRQVKVDELPGWTVYMRE